MAIIASVISVAAVVVAVHQAQTAKDQARSAREQVQESRAQTDLQRRMHRNAAQPYVWVDVRPVDGHGQLVRVVLQHGGPTVATDIRVAFTPPLTDGSNRPGEHFTGLDAGVSSLAPARWMMWNLGISHELLGTPLASAYEVTVDANGPFGAVDQLRYTIDLSQWSNTTAQPPGTLHELRNAVRDVAKAIEKRS